MTKNTLFPIVVGDRAHKGGVSGATVGAPLAVAISVGYVASEAFDWFCDLF
ncbi:hypothetical protein MX652_15795 [Thauera aromatica]|nr:hypothetical protein [Thauera aromatica]MCK2128144.1 hypothetical protein [Thauera aromatica]